MDEQTFGKKLRPETDVSRMLELSSSLDAALSKEQKNKVTNILSQVSELSDVEKLMLYLKLPTDVPDEHSKHPPPPMSERTHAAIKWIRSQYVEDEQLCLLKQDVYDDYRERCEAARNNPISSCDFAKMMKFVFPNVYQRRLGKRGRSRYYYAGLKSKENSGSACHAVKLTPSADKDDEDVYTLSCQLVCEWASQLLERPFFDIQNLSDYLISIGVSCGKAATKFTQLSGSSEHLDQERKSPTTRLQDMQMLLQRKFQHKEVIREHKQKVVQQKKHQKEQEFVKDVTSQSALNSKIYRSKADDKNTKVISKIPRGRSQPCLWSFQPYTNTVSSSTSADKPVVCGTVFDGKSLLHSAVLTQKDPCSTAANLTEGTFVNENLCIPVQIKRCHSTSEVEKHSVLVMESKSNMVKSAVAGGHLSSTSIMNTSQLSVEDTAAIQSQQGHSAHNEIYIVPQDSNAITKLCPSVSVSHASSARTLELSVQQRSLSGLCVPQHPKRNGDNISPDRNSCTKRRCMTSLGVIKQQSLDVDMVGSKLSDEELTRVRPYSCPISTDNSQFEQDTEQGSPLDILSADTQILKAYTTENIKSSCTYNDGHMSETRMTGDVLNILNTGGESEKVKSVELQQKRASSLVHFVKKPTVINRPISILHTMASCPDLKQNDLLSERKHLETKTSKSSYSILNSLLSSSCTILPESVKASEISSAGPSTFLQTTHSIGEQSKSSLQSSPLRPVTYSCNSAENSGILSSLSSRSAFVPVTSNKLLTGTNRKESDDVVTLPSLQAQLPLLNREKEHGFQYEDKHTLNTGTSALVFPEPAQNSSPQSDCKQEKPVAKLRLAKHNLLDSLSSSSSSSSSSSTLCQSGESTNSSGESSFATPVPVSGTEKSDVILKSVPVVLSTSEIITSTTSSSHTPGTVVQCKLSPSKMSVTPVLASHMVQCSRTPQTRTTTTSPITQPKRTSRNRFTPIRPKLSNGTSTPSPQKLAGGGTTSSPQKTDMRRVCTILKEQRVKTAQDLLVNLANNYQGEVKLQMPAELLGLSPAGKSNSGDVLVTISPPSNSIHINSPKSYTSSSSDLYSQVWPLTSTTPTQKEIKVVVEPIPQATCQPNVNSALSTCLLSTTPPVLQGIAPAVQVLSQNMHTTGAVPQTLLAQGSAVSSQTSQTQPLSLALTASGADAHIIIIPPHLASPQTTQSIRENSTKPIIVEDEKGNMYSLDQKSGSTIVTQDLQKLFKSNQIVSSVTSDIKTSFITSSSGLLNVSEIKGHVVGPDSHGQTYLLVPNSEPVISTSSTAIFNLIPQQTSPVLTTTVTSSTAKSPIISGTVTSSATVTGIIQPRATSSSALLTELSQLVSTGQNMSGQLLIQHNSSSSAFHKCASSAHRKDDIKGAETVLLKQDNASKDHSSTHASLPENKTLQQEITGSEQVNEHNLHTRCQEAANELSSRIRKEMLDIQKGQGLRKRKASKNYNDDHEDKKRLNTSNDEKEMDSDVLIVNVENSSAVSTFDERNARSCAMSQSEYLQPPIVPKHSSNTDSNINSGGAEKSVITFATDVTDTETLLSIIEDSKSITIKEAIKALNDLRARQNKENRSSQNKSRPYESDYRDQPGFADGIRQGISLADSQHHETRRPRSDYKRSYKSQTARCNSVSPYLFEGTPLHTVNLESLSASDKGFPKVQRTSKRHISLNLESLESDALLDTEPTLDHRLVVDSRDVPVVKSDQKTSIGVAAKSAKSTHPVLSSDQDRETKNKPKHIQQPLAVSSRALKSYQMLLDKKRLDKICSHVPDAVSSSQSGDSQVDAHKDPGGHPAGKQDKISQLCASSIIGESNSALSSEQPRSMSCVRDILQSKVKFMKPDFIKGITETIFSSTTRNLSKSRASDHPFLAQRLSTSKIGGQVKDFGCKPDLSTGKPCDVNVSLKSDGNIVSAKSLITDSELPGEIIDFITESMSSGNPYHFDAHQDNSLSSLVADLLRKGQETKGSACTTKEGLWRSVSVPNTIPDVSIFCDKSVTSECEKFLKETQLHTLLSSRSQSASDFKNDTTFVGDPSKQLSVCDNAPKSGSCSWNGESHPLTGVHHPENFGIVQVKEVSSDSGLPLSSGTFLSPIGPARSTRRSSVERSVSGDRSSTKTPVDTPGSKSCTDRPPSRMKTPVDRSQTRTPVDRSLMITPVDRSLSRTSTDRVGRRTPRDKSPNRVESHQIRDLTTAAVLQQSGKESRKMTVNRVLTHSPAEKLPPNMASDKQFQEGSTDNLNQQGSLESMREDRSLSQTPVSDGGYSSVSQTPISDIGYSSVSPSPIMMSTPGLFGECGRRDLTSPATIFMPLRSDSVMSMMNSGRSNDGIDGTGITGRGNTSFSVFSNGYPAVSISPGVPNICEDNRDGNGNHSMSFGQDIGPNEPSFFQEQDAFDETMFDSALIKDSEGCNIVRAPDSVFTDTSSSLLDLEKLLSVQLHCIPTPPCSPSSSPQHSSEVVQSPLPFSNICSPQAGSGPLVCAVSCSRMSPFPSGTVTSVAASSVNWIQTTSAYSSLNNYSTHDSLNIAPNIFSSLHQYNPHPSPPFTPSSQRCLNSPRCPTPCSHRSLLSPQCPTPCGDLSSAPNRFMPIQTSGILTTPSASTQAYIQPIRPVVTLASMVHHNSHLGPVISKTDNLLARANLNKYSSRSVKTLEVEADLCEVVSNEHFLNTAILTEKLDLDQQGTTPLASEKAFPSTHQNCSTESISFFHKNVKSPHYLNKDWKIERSTQPALVLSLTGSIGTVSGQGMKTGWSKELAGLGCTSNYFQGGQESRNNTFPKLATRLSLSSSVPHTVSSSDLNLSSEILPTYEEAVLHLGGSDLESLRISHTKDSSLPAISDLRSETTAKENQKCSDRGLVHVTSETAEALDVTDRVEVARNKFDLELDQNAVTETFMKDVCPKSQKEINLGESTETFKSELANASKSFPFSLQLALLSGRSGSSSVEQPHEAKLYNSQTHSTSNVSTTSHDNSSIYSCRASGLKAMLKAPPFDPDQSFELTNINSFQPFKSVTELPTAYYAGTAPNIDLTKRTLSSASRQLGVTFEPMAQQRTHNSTADIVSCNMSLSGQLAKEVHNSISEHDDLEETLDVLKSLDSQYFQHEDDGGSSDLLG